MAWYRIAENVLDAIADAINAKTGKSAPMTPVEMVLEIQSIPSGGEDLLKKRITNTLTSYTINVSNVMANAFNGCSALISVDFPSTVTITESAFKGIGARVIHLKNAIFNGYNTFRECPNLETFVCENLTKAAISFYMCYDCVNLTIVDVNTGAIDQDFLTVGGGKRSKLNTVILRKNDGITTLASVAQLPGAFASNGSGGTLYVPQALISDYQNATNWSTILGYPNNQILSIEGSIYETQFADGTPISTT